MSEQKESTNFFNKTAETVELTYNGLEKPIIFHLRPLLSKEAKEAQQKFLGLEEAEQQKTEHRHDVEMLALLSVKEPENLPTFERQEKETIGDAITRFFSDGNEIKMRVADHAMIRYNRLMQPKEFFR